MSKKIILIVITIMIVAGIGYLLYQSAPEELTEIEKACIDSGGEISTSLCCKSTDDFPNLCLIGPCSCSPENSHQIKVCDCGSNKCFNGSECVLLEIQAKDDMDNQFYLHELIDFPISSKATLVSTDFIPPCEQPDFPSYCNVKVYTWEIDTIYPHIDNWLLKETKKAGWNCFVGERDSIKTIGASFQTECQKNDLIYGLRLRGEEDVTTITLFVPLGPSLW